MNQYLNPKEDSTKLRFGMKRWQTPSGDKVKVTVVRIRIWRIWNNVEERARHVHEGSEYAGNWKFDEEPLLPNPLSELKKQFEPHGLEVTGVNARWPMVDRKAVIILVVVQERR